MNANIKESLKAMFCSFVDAISDQQTAPQPVQATNGNLPMKKYLSVKEASDYLGLSKQRIYELKMQKKIPCFKVNDNGSKSGKVWFSLEALDNFILSGAIKSKAEIQTEAERNLSELQ